MNNSMQHASRFTEADFKGKSSLEIAREIIGSTLIIDDTAYRIEKILLYHEDTVEKEEYYNAQTTIRLRKNFDRGEVYTIYSMGQPLAGIKLGKKTSAETSGDSSALFLEQLSRIENGEVGELMGTTRSQVAKALGLVKDAPLLGENIFESNRIFISKENVLPGKIKEKFHPKDQVIRSLALDNA